MDTHQNSNSVEESVGEIVQQNEAASRPKKLPLWAQITIAAILLLSVSGIFLYKNSTRNGSRSPNTSEIGVNITRTFNIDNLLKQNLPTIVDFGSDTCIPCKEMQPILTDLNESLQGRALVKFVDVNKNYDAAKNFPINLIPAQFFWNADGTPYVPKAAQSIGFTLYKNAQGVHVLTAHEGTLTKQEILEILSEMGMKQ